MLFINKKLETCCAYWRDYDGYHSDRDDAALAHRVHEYRRRKGIFEELYITRAAGFVLCKDGGRIRRFFFGI